jgi:hypothetical protein
MLRIPRLIESVLLFYLTVSVLFWSLTYDSSPWMGDRRISKQLPTQRTQRNSYIHPMCEIGFRDVGVSVIEI